MSGSPRSHPSEISSTTGPWPSTRRAQRTLNVRKRFADPRAAAPVGHLSENARDGSSAPRVASSRVIRVSRVAKRNASTRAEPRSRQAVDEVQQHARVALHRSADVADQHERAALHARRARVGSASGSPPYRMLRRTTRRRSIAPSRRRPPAPRAPHARGPTRARAIIAFACRSSSSVNCAKSLRRDTRARCSSSARRARAAR